MNMGFTFTADSNINFSVLKFHADFFPTMLYADKAAPNTGIVFAPALQEIVDRGMGTTTSQSNISYKTEGAVGSRIFKVEWSNVGFSGEITPDNISSDFANLQIWFYEGSNIMEFHFGPSFITNPSQSYWGETGVASGIYPDVNILDGTINGSAYFMSGDASTPTYNFSTAYETYMTGFPANGTVYRYTPVSLLATAESQVNTCLTIAPTMVADSFSVMNTSKEKIMSVQIFDTSGRLVNTFTKDFDRISALELQKGSYLVVINTSKGKSSHKIIKK